MALNLKLKRMNFKKSLIGSSIAFIIATSCCWLPALAIALGGASGLMSFSNGLEQFSGVFMKIGGALLVYGGYLFYQKNRKPAIVLQSKITCPNCGHCKMETMPTDACQYFYECENCKKLLKPQQGDCCVYCSYGSVTCPPIQLNQDCC